MIRTNKMPSMSNVAAGSTASANLPIGLSYLRLMMTYAGVTLAQLKNLVIEINGKPVQAFKDAAELDKLNQYYKRGAANGILNIWFIRPELTGKKSQATAQGIITVNDSDLTAIGTADVQTLTLKVDIDAGAAAPELTLHAVRGPQQPLGLITKVKSFPRAFATTGQQDIDTLPRGGARIAAIHLFKADVSAAEVEANSVKVIDGPKALLEEEQTRMGRTPQTGSATHLDFCLSGDILDSLETRGLQDFRLRPTIDTQGEVRAIVEYLDGFAGL
jgi:hypothetical protein